MNPRHIVEIVRRAVSEFGYELSRPLNLALAFFLSPLPRRYWGGATGVGILLSGFVQMGASARGLLRAYTAHAQQVSDALAQATITAALNSGDVTVSAAPAMAFGALTPFGFLAVSVPAWIFAYGAISGLVRVFGYAADHPCGDPILTFIDDLVWDGMRSLWSVVRQASHRIRSFWRAE